MLTWQRPFFNPLTADEHGMLCLNCPKSFFTAIRRKRNLTALSSGQAAKVSSVLQIRANTGNRSSTRAVSVLLSNVLTEDLLRSLTAPALDPEESAFHWMMEKPGKRLIKDLC